MSPHLITTQRANPVWVLISAVPLQIGSVASIVYVLSSDSKNKAYSLLFLIPIVGPIITHVLMIQKDRYLSSMAEWIFIGQIAGYIILKVLLILG